MKQSSTAWLDFAIRGPEYLGNASYGPCFKRDLSNSEDATCPPVKKDFSILYKILLKERYKQHHCMSRRVPSKWLHLQEAKSFCPAQLCTGDQGSAFAQIFLVR